MPKRESQGRPRPRVSSDSEAQRPDLKATVLRGETGESAGSIMRSQTSSGDGPTNRFIIRLPHCGTGLHKEESLAFLFLCSRLSGGDQSV